MPAAVAFLLWRRRPREAYARRPQFDLFTPAEPEPPPSVPPPAEPRSSAAAPAPRTSCPRLQSAAAPHRPGSSSSRLRPSLEIGVQPLRCVVDDDQVTIEFELELFNSGTAPARAVLAEASLFNAGATQDQDLAAFFANPVATASGST